MKYLVTCFLLLCSSFVFADTLKIDTMTLNTIITGTYLGTTTTQYGPLIQFNATGISFVEVKQPAPHFKPLPPNHPPKYESYAWEGRFPGNRTYDGVGICYETRDSIPYDIQLSCTEAETYIEEPLCRPFPVCQQ